MTTLRWTFLAGLALWTAYVVAYPTWVGEVFVSVTESAAPAKGAAPVDFVQQIRSTGTFGLDREGRPLWDPPAAFGGGPGRVRWPWQPAGPGEWVELGLGSMAARVGRGVLLLGILCGGAYRLGRHGRVDTALEVAWACSATTLVAMLVLFAVGFFTMGFGLSEGLALGAYGLAFVAGGGIGLWVARAERRDAAPEPPGEVWTPTRGDRVASHLGLFVVGLSASFPMLLTAMALAQPFRGALAGLSEVGTPLYAGGQALVNLIVGFLMADVGVVLAALARRLPWSSAFTYGLGIGLILLGVVVGFFWF